MTALSLVTHSRIYGRAVPEFCPVQFAERQESYCPSVHEKDVLEIDGHHASFLFEQAPEEIHILPCNLSADAQDHKILSDSAGVRSKRRLVMSC
jgi:hypothetical protein